MSIKQSCTSFIIAITICFFGFAEAADFDPYNIKQAQFSGIANKTTFTDKDGTTYRTINTKRSQGVEILITRDGKKKWLKHGVLYQNHSSGQLKSRTNFRLGKKDGSYEAYSTKGVLKFERTYRNGLVDGKWYQYNEQGALTDEREYVLNKRHGKSYLYHTITGSKKGPINFEKSYKDGKKHGVESQYSKKGKLVARRVYQDGNKVGKTEWLR